MKYRLLVLDIDGTLTNSRKEITAHTLEVLERVQQSGVKIVLASGRPTYGIVPLARALGMDRRGGYILSFNGGSIIDAQTMETIYSQRLPREIIPQLYSAAEQGGAQIISYRKEKIIASCSGNEYIEYESMLTNMEVEQVENFCEAIDFDPDKCLIVGEPASIIPIGEELNARFPQTLSAYRSEPFFLEVVPRNIDKALSLTRLFEHVGVSKESVMAIGDGFNDLSMIRLAGLGVAMANAQEEVKAAAEHITESCDEDGVAAAALKFLL